MKKVQRKYLAFATLTGLAALAIGLVPIAPALAAADSVVHGGGGNGGGGGGGGRAPVSETYPGGSGGAVGAAGGPSGALGHVGGAGAPGNQTLPGGGGGGGAKPAAGATATSELGGAGGTAGAAIQGKDAGFTAGGAGGDGAGDMGVAVSGAGPADCGNIIALGGNGGNGGNGGDGNPSNPAAKGGAGGAGGVGGLASNTRTGDLACSGQVLVKSGLPGLPGANGAGNGGAGGKGGDGGPATVSLLSGVVTVPTINVIKPAGGGKASLNVSSLHVTGHTVITVDNTAAADVKLTTVTLEPGSDLEIVSLNGGQLTITLLDGSLGGDITGNVGAATVVTALPAVGLTALTLPESQNTVAYSQSVVGSVTGFRPFSYALSSGSLPNGLTLSASGVLSGTPDDLVDTYLFDVQVTDVLGRSATATYELVVNPAPPVPDPDNSTLEVQEVTPIDAGHPCVVADGLDQWTGLVQVNDQYGDPIEGAGVAISGSPQLSLSPAGPYTSADDGQIEVFLTSLTSGSFDLWAEVDSTNVTGSPAEVVFCAGPASATTSVLEGPVAAAVADGVATQVVKATIKDVNGNPVIGTAVSFSVPTNVQVEGGGSSVQSTDGSGEATLTLVSTKAGTFPVTASAEGTAITTGSPAQIQFLPGPATELASTITSDRGYVEANLANWSARGVVDQAQLTVVLHDQFGNAVGTSGGVVEVSASDPAVQLENGGLAHDAANGTYTIKVASPVDGLVTFSFAINGGPVASSTADVRFVPTPTAPTF
ncbi:MAG: Ig-like domain-containing protein, partial [Micrococcales bacterium]|nr:Ig-like domain-containing protein [Micrococcales bacterium]